MPASSSGLCQHVQQSEHELLSASSSTDHHPPSDALAAGFTSGRQSSRHDSAQPDDATAISLTDAAQTTASQSMSSREAELEGKLGELTRRLTTAEQAAGHQTQLHSQLQQVKADKAALQSELKQFMQHTSSMMTTLQSQISRLIVAAPSGSAQVAPESSQRASASRAGQAGQGTPTHGLHVGDPEGWLGQAQGHASPPAAPQIRSSVQEWLVESHGNQPSPLAHHEIFQGSSPPVQSSRPVQGSAMQQGIPPSWVDELQQAPGRRQVQVSCPYLYVVSGQTLTVQLITHALVPYSLQRRAIHQSILFSSRLKPIACCVVYTRTLSSAAQLSSCATPDARSSWHQDCNLCQFTVMFGLAFGLYTSPWHMLR